MMRKSGLVFLIAIVAAGGGYFFARNRTVVLASSAEYHAVLLSNGSVYFGKLEGLGGPNPVLRDVYYVQSAVDEKTKAVDSILIKRGKEWHAPDRMILQAPNVVFVEPVSPNSRVAQLISDSKRQ